MAVFHCVSFYAHASLRPGLTLFLLFPEMILAVLVKSFVFEFPEKKDIVWNLGGIQTPSVKGAEAQTPHLPMKVTLLSNKH